MPGQPASADPSKEQQKQRRKIRRSFFYYLVGMLLMYSGFTALLTLQSSVNIEQGLGTTTIAVSYVFSITFNLFCTPLVVRCFGAKKCIIACNIGYLIYAAANLYPRYYTLIPAGLAMGLAEATLWTCVTMMNVYFATEYAKYSRRGEVYYISLFSGYFYVGYNLNEIFGNLVSYTILYGFDSARNETLRETRTNSTNLPQYIGDIDRYAVCGKDDCQNAEDIHANMNQYKPANPTTLYILIGILMAFHMMASLIYIFLVPDIGTYVRNSKIKQSNPADNNILIEQSVENSESKSDEVENKDGVSLYLHEIAARPDKEDVRSGLVANTLKSTCRQMIQPQQLLMVIPALYNGLSNGFTASEITRSYASCVLGVSSVGLLVIIFALSDMIASWAVGKYGVLCGHIKLFALACIVDLANYAYCIYWKPSLDTSWTIYVLFASFGLTDGIIQFIVNVSYVNYFPNNQEIAMSIWTIFINIGICLQYGWSTLLCVYTKVYIQVTVLICAAITQVYAEYRYKKMLKRKTIQGQRC